jgi:hypothetical protein
VPDVDGPLLIGGAYMQVKFYPTFHKKPNSTAVPGTGVTAVPIDGEIKGDIIYPPYTLEIKDIPDGEHEIGLKLYTHRYNSFGPIHLVDVNEKWHGPNVWRTEGINWSYEYVLRTTGILKTPGIR